MLSEMNGQEDQPTRFVGLRLPLMKKCSLYWIEEIGARIRAQGTDIPFCDRIDEFDAPYALHNLLNKSRAISGGPQARQ
jgi:hypothetical protein